MAISAITRDPNFLISFKTRDQFFDADAVRDSIYAISVERVMGQTAGTFQITLSPKLIQDGVGWKDILSPMDYVEILIDSGAGISSSPLTSGITGREEPAVVMRGFIDSVIYTGSIGSGTPSRTVMVTGRDFGKIALLTPLYDYREGIPPVVQIIQNFMQGRQLFHGEVPPGTAAGTRTDGNAKAEQPALGLVDVMKIIFDNFLLPHLTTINQIGLIGASRGSTTLTYDFTGIDPWSLANLFTFNPYALEADFEPFTPIWSLLEKYANKPWQELYFDDDNLGQKLIHRTSPWLDINDNPIGGALPVYSASLDGNWIVNWAFGQSDQEVINFFMSQSLNYETIPKMRLSIADLAKQGSLVVGTGKNPTIIDDQNKPSNFVRFGLRPRSFQSLYFNFGRAIPDTTLDDSTDFIGSELNNRVVQAFSFAELLVAGNLVIRGTPQIHIGDYIKVTFENTLYTFYVESVLHAMDISGGESVYLTTLGLTRGSF